MVLALQISLYLGMKTQKLRNLLIISILGILISSLSACNDNAEAANKMAEEMCAAMDLIQEGDAMSLLDAAGKMAEISKKTEQYGRVTEAQLEKAMKEKCPEGWEKFEDLKSQ